MSNFEESLARGETTESGALEVGFYGNAFLTFEVVLPPTLNMVQDVAGGL
jgi:hypothetical protein